MFLGHFGAAFALKRVEPKVSLGTLFVASQLVDLLWGCFLLLGWEHANIVPGFTAVTPLRFVDYPISHSLVGGLAWAAVAAALYYSWPTRDTSRHWQAAAIVGVAVLSHYPLDVLVHIPDLPLAGSDSPKLGLGLWNHPSLTIALELAALAAGVAVYVAYRSQRHPVRTGRLVGLLVVLIAIYLASVFGPPPPSMNLVAWADLAMGLILGSAAAWVDRPARPGDRHSS